MSGINVSGFLTKSFDWQTTVDQLIEVSSAPKTKLEAEQTANTEKVGALAEIKAAMLDLQETVRTLWDSTLYTARTVSSDTTGSTWRANSAAGAEVGSCQLAVSQLATTAQLKGATDIGSGLTGSTIATLNTATAITAGKFSINGQTVTVAASDTLDQVLARIGTATSGQVTASYSAATDKITLSSTASIMVGAANDTSNFLTAVGLSNNITLGNGTYSVASTSALGTVMTDAPLATAGLRGTVPSSGSFVINGVTISYADTDSLNTVLARINASAAGVTAAYDATNDRVTLTNSKTGDFGISVSEGTTGLAAALGLTTAAGASFTAGKNALFSVDGGVTRTSASNTLDATALGISGLSVTVTTPTTQTLEIAASTDSLETAIGSFLEKYNAFQALVDDYTEITTTGGVISSAVLAGEREVESWGTQMRALVFGSVSSATGSVKRLNDLGLDFTGTSSTLVLKDPTKLAEALADYPEDVASFFQTGSTSFTSRLYSYLTEATAQDSDEQDRLTQTNSDLDTQIAEIQRRLDSERELLTSAFLKMQDAQAKAQDQQTYLTNTFFKSSSS